MDAELVDGEGWVSDESSFYGDEDTRATLERATERHLELPFDPFAHLLRQKAKTSSHSTTTKSDETLQDRSRSRPAIATLEKSVATLRSSTTRENGSDVRGEEAADLLRNDRFNGNRAAWQQNETILEFLKRLPVSDPATADVGPWLWVSRPQSHSRREHQPEAGSVNQFVELGEALLDAFIKRKSKTEAENADKAPSTITRRMRPFRDQLEENLLAAAVKSGVVCGKWMLFPSSNDLPRYWKLVAEGTAEGRLGPVSKVGTYDPFDGKDRTLICAYTHDFTDMQDVRRVLDELLRLDLCTKDSTPIYYKCDAFTYLGISSDNSYKLRASMFSSKEVFGNEPRTREDGPIARLRKQSEDG